MKDFFLSAARSGFGADDIGDDFPCFLDEHHVADANILARDFAGVMQAGPADGGAGKLYRFQMRHGREDASLADLHLDAQKLGQGLFRLVLVSDHPARRLAGGAELLAVLERIDLDHHPVGLIAELAANLLELLDRLQNFVDDFS